MLSLPAAAFELLNPPRRWFPDDLLRTVIVDDGGLVDVADGDGGVTAALAAVEAWNSGAVTILASVSGPPDVGLGDGLSHLVFDDPFKICKGLCLAATLTGFFDDTQTGTCDGLDVVLIADSDIFFNTSGPVAHWTSEIEDPSGVGCAGEIYVEAVSTHEIGHLIGLGHSANAAALMAPTIGSCDNKLLHDDDLAGRDALYDCAFIFPCGDGIVAPGEQCDDGNLVSGDGCSATCLVELCFACAGAPSVCTCDVGATCGIACLQTLFCTDAEGSCECAAP